MRLYFARHGETDWNVKRLIQGTTDTDLNENGRRQAQALAESLAVKGITRVYTSPLRRAADTGRFVAEKLGIPCIQKDGLQELDLGDWEGHSWDEVKTGWKEQYEYRLANIADVPPPGGESYMQLAERVIKAVKEILAETDGDTLIVSHGGTIQITLGVINGTSLYTLSKDYPVPNTCLFEVEPEKFLRY